MNNSLRLQKLISMYSDDTTDSFVIFALAKEYENLENFEKALEHYTELRTKDPQYVGLYFHLANLYAVLEETENALKTYEEGISIAQSQNDLHALSELKNAKLNFEMEEGL